jgi:hypothetical protein
MAHTTPGASDDGSASDVAALLGALEQTTLGCAASRVAALPEMWALFAEHSDEGFVGAWRLMRVCKAAREGAKDWLRTLPGLVVCGGVTFGREMTSEVWRLALGELRWERMPSLTRARNDHACCVVRGRVVVLGGNVDAEDDESPVITVASVEIFEAEAEENMFPPLSCGPIRSSIALAIDESESELGQVLLIGGGDEDVDASSAVDIVDLATGRCTPQPPLLSQLGSLTGCTALRLPDGRIVCVGQNDDDGLDGTAQVLEPPKQGSPSEAGWQWRYLTPMSVGRWYGGGCVLSDGRFAVFGGWDNND